MDVPVEAPAVKKVRKSEWLSTIPVDVWAMILPYIKDRETFVQGVHEVKLYHAFKCYKLSVTPQTFGLELFDSIRDYFVGVMLRPAEERESILDFVIDRLERKLIILPDEGFWEKDKNLMEDVNRLVREVLNPKALTPFHAIFEGQLSADAEAMIGLTPAKLAYPLCLKQLINYLKTLKSDTTYSESDALLRSRGPNRSAAFLRTMGELILIIFGVVLLVTNSKDDHPGTLSTVGGSLSLAAGVLSVASKFEVFTRIRNFARGNYCPSFWSSAGERQPLILSPINQAPEDRMERGDAIQSTTNLNNNNNV